MGVESGGLRAVVDAPLEDIVAALLNFESYPQWQAIMKACTVLERDDEGRGSVVEFRVDAKVRTVRYVSRYAYDLPSGFSWDLVSGDLKRNSGRYAFAAREDGGTDVTIAIYFEAGFFVPGPLKNAIRDRSLHNSIRELRRRVRVEPAG